MSSTQVPVPTFDTSSNLLNLPLEVLSLVVYDIAYSSPLAKSQPTSLTSTNDLISLSLAHHTFAILAAPYLLRTLTLTVSTHPSALSKLSRLETVLRSVRGLEEYVRRLKWVLDDPLKPEDSSNLPSDLLERFGHLPSLEALEIHCGIPYALSEFSFEGLVSNPWYFKPLYRPNYLSEAAEANYITDPTYPSSAKLSLSPIVLSFYSLFTLYIPLTSKIYCSLPKLTNLTLSGITSLPLLAVFNIPSLQSLTLSTCSAILQKDGGTSPLHPSTNHPNRALKYFKALDVLIYINPDDKTTPSLPWFLKDVESIWLEDFGYHGPDPVSSDLSGQVEQALETPFSYRHLKQLTCAGILDFHPLVGTGYNTNLNAGDITSASTPFPVLQEFVFEQTWSYPTDHLCSLYPYFRNLEVFQIGLTSQPQLNTHSPLYHFNLAAILDRPEDRLKFLIIRRYESVSDALETLRELSDALTALSDPISPRVPVLQSIIIDLTLTSSDLTHLERLYEAWHRLSSILELRAKKSEIQSMMASSLESREVTVELIWTGVQE